ncbi:CHAT domain-containing protein [Micromonospora carbonacea]|uniref:CHAT domain-containing protein n=1 Tax=Micromonospora carbonacea TaxID=47853 RepID=UPI0037184EF3
MPDGATAASDDPPPPGDTTGSGATGPAQDGPTLLAGVVELFHRYVALADDDATEAAELRAELLGHRGACAELPAGPERDMAALHLGLALAEGEPEAEDLRSAVELLAGPVWSLPPEPVVALGAARLVWALVLTGAPPQGPTLVAAVDRAMTLIEPAERVRYAQLMAQLCGERHSRTGRPELREAGIRLTDAGLAGAGAEPQIVLDLHFWRLTLMLSGPDWQMVVRARPEAVTEAYRAWLAAEPSDLRDWLAAVLALAALPAWSVGRPPFAPSVWQQLYEQGRRAKGLPGTVQLGLATGQRLLDAMGVVPGEPDPYAGADDLDRLVRAGATGGSAELGRGLSSLAGHLLPLLVLLDAHRSGDLAALHRAEAALADSADPFIGRLGAMMTDLRRAGQSPELERRLLDDARRMAEQNPADEHSRLLVDMIESFLGVRGAPARPVPGPGGPAAHRGAPRPAGTAAATGSGPAAAIRPDPPLLGQAMVLSSVAGRWRANRGDPAVLRQAAVEVERLLGDPSAGTMVIEPAVELLAEIRLDLARLTRRRADAAEAVRQGERALGVIGGPYAARWPGAVRRLAEALRLRSGGFGADQRRARELGLAVLRGYAWQTLLQSRTEHAVTAAARAAAEAVYTAAQCVHDGALDDAVRALDAGRGLVLYASTAARSVPAMLRAAGRSDLARRWGEADRATGAAAAVVGAGALDAGIVPDDLRHQVLRVLTGIEPGRQPVGSEAVARSRRSGVPTGAAVALLDPPSLAEIRAALRAQRLDLLAYLVPGPGRQGGLMVLVPAEGAVTVLRSAELSSGAGELRDYLRALTERQSAPEERSAEAAVRWRDHLESLCDWGWRAAMDPLMRHLRRQRGGPVPRIGLVPMGPLGVVPWHAARRFERGVPHYAVQELEISYVPSARLLCQGAETVAGGRQRRVIDALMIGDPGGDQGVGGEARAVRDAFYPGLPLHVGPDASVARLRDWLVRPAGGQRRLLHLGCHGTVEVERPWESRLELAGGEHLTAGQLLDLGRDRAALVDLVLLAACETGLTGADYDEVFSLATAFLVAGARSVVGSLWAVYDDATSLAMFMIHHFLRDRGLPPAAALRATQLWMLDPDRLAPSTMPPKLRELSMRPRWAKPFAWSGFIHLGATSG